MSADQIDRSVYLMRTGRAHVVALAHLTETHSIPATASYLLQSTVCGEKDPDFEAILAAIATNCDTDPASPTYGCLKWFSEECAIADTNAAFFICLPLSLLYLLEGARLSPAELAALRRLFEGVAPWFGHMAASPSLFYPNKCLGDVAMLLATGRILADEALTARARSFCRRFLDYADARGMGWGEDHSPGYTTVIVEMLLFVMLLEGSGELYQRARQLIDSLMEWVVFHDGCDAVPSIRGYNFDCQIEITYRLRELLAGQAPQDPTAPLSMLAAAVGYSYQPQPLPVPRSSRRRTFDEHYSVSHIGPHARLGVLSHYPLMPNTYMHDEWGLGWQTKPAAFIVGREEYGVLEWVTEDDEGMVRHHQIATGFQEWHSRHLFKRLGFHPEVLFTGHQEGGAAIILREIRNLHSPTVQAVDRWRLAHSAGRVLIAATEWDGQPLAAPPDWLVLDYGCAAVALRPLKCRLPDVASDDPNLQRRTAGEIVELSPRLEQGARGTTISLPLIEGAAGVVTQPLLFSGWCVVLLDRPEDVAHLTVSERFDEDGELPRTYGELIRTVELTTPATRLKLVRDMLTGEESRWVNGQRVDGVR